MELISTRDHEQHLANQISEYWARRGYSVTTTILPFRMSGYETPGDASGFVLRSDMVNGWPTRRNR